MKLRLITILSLFVLCLSSCTEIVTGVRRTQFRVASEYYNNQELGFTEAFLMQDIGLKGDNLSARWMAYCFPIENFDYEEGYEYVLLVKITEGTVLDKNLADGDWIRYSCLKVISKEKKDSNVDTTDIRIMFYP